MQLLNIHYIIVVLLICRFLKKEYREENTPDTTNLNGLYFDEKNDDTSQKMKQRRSRNA